MSAGRRNPRSIARFSELSAFLSSSRSFSGDAYTDLSGTAVPVHNEADPALEPYKKLDVSRLKISGRWRWDPCPFVSDELYLLLLTSFAFGIGRIPKRLRPSPAFGTSVGCCAWPLPMSRPPRPLSWPNRSTVSRILRGAARILQSAGLPASVGTSLCGLAWG